ncbi:amidohydrolase [Sphingomonas parva]|uniref:Amidohydrolase n=1 Tax=Sphingomonas parva TaxID=2555898 RepID=A0A4Y8ZL63_9SPHN|nr:amidohydrolase [Sphingomonas parva]TFI56728.1 amidohydrolase [Sphingomonas parva]
MRKALLPAAALALAPSAPAAADTLSDQVRADMPSLTALYRDLHANPELSMQEVKTAAKLAAEAKKAGFAVTGGVGKTGVVAVMKNGPGPVLLIRADMDGLPVVEQTGLPFASKVRATSLAGVESGVMHACGHDTHMAAWVGTARRLAAMKDRWSGTLVMIAQPGEEIGQGAKAMLDDGLYTRFPKPSHAIAFHDSAGLPAGTIGYSVGPALANVDSVDIVVKGVGGHGAYPHTTRDPIVLASRIVTALQTLVSREVDPQEPAVVTVGSFHAGAKHNIISDEATLLLTVRSYTDETRKILLDGIARIVRGEAIAAGIPEDRMPVVTQRGNDYTPATINTEALSTSTAALFTSRFGAERVVKTRPVMGGEDFGRFHLADPSIESMIFWVGGVPKAQWDAAGGDPAKLPSLHSPFWVPEAETVISTATEAMVTAALGVLGKP